GVVDRAAVEAERALLRDRDGGRGVDRGRVVELPLDPQHAGRRVVAGHGGGEVALAPAAGDRRGRVDRLGRVDLDRLVVPGGRVAGLVDHAGLERLDAVG